MSSKKPSNRAKLPDDAAMIVFGLDAANKPRAGYFGKDQAELAKKAAASVGYHALIIETDDQRALTEKLRPGQANATGSGLVPLVGHRVFEKIAAAAGIETSAAATSGKSAKQATPPVRGVPNRFADIDAGHLVIAHCSARDGWWEAIVVERDKDMFKLRWRDYPKDPMFTRHRTSLALPHPVS